MEPLNSADRVRLYVTTDIGNFIGGSPDSSRMAMLALDALIQQLKARDTHIYSFEVQRTTLYVTINKPILTTPELDEMLKSIWHPLRALLISK